MWFKYEAAKELMEWPERSLHGYAVYSVLRDLACNTVGIPDDKNAAARLSGFSSDQIENAWQHFRDRCIEQDGKLIFKAFIEAQEIYKIKSEQAKEKARKRWNEVNEEKERLKQEKEAAQALPQQIQGTAAEVQQQCNGNATALQQQCNGNADRDRDRDRDRDLEIQEIQIPSADGHSPLPPVDDFESAPDEQPEASKPAKPKKQQAKKPDTPEEVEAENQRKEYRAIFSEAYRQAYTGNCEETAAGNAQLARTQKTQPDVLNAENWRIAVRNYFASPLGEHTMKDLAPKFLVFLKHPLDRYGKPQAAIPIDPYAGLSPNSAARKEFID